MISHFNLGGHENSFYLEISSIQSSSTGLKISGIAGDGSAEDWFEACVGERLEVALLPVWQSEVDSLCQRYDQEQLEEGLRHCLEEVSFRSEKSFDPDSGCWQQKFVAVPKASCAPFWPMGRSERPHAWVCEADVIWFRQQGGCYSC